MPAYLNGFDYDVFISYGWAGAQRPDEGDRGWVGEFAGRLETEMKARLEVSRCELFLDRDASRSGYLNQNLARALSSSGVLIFVVSPGSCRSDSWCRFEVAHFLDTAQPVAHPGLFREDRLFKVELRKVEQGGEPAQVDRCVPYSFADREFNTPLPVTDIAHRGSEAYPSFQSLCRDLEKLLRRARRLQESGKPPSGKTVFVGAVPEELRENRDRRLNSLESDGHRVLLATPIAGEPDENFLSRTKGALSDAHTSVHLFGTAALYGPSALQARAALESNATKIYIWRDRDAAFDVMHERFLAELQRACLENAKSGRVEFPEGGADSYLDPNLVSDLSQREIPTPVESPASGCTVMLHFDAKDGPNVDSVVQRLKDKGLEVQPPIFGGSRKQREDKNLEFSRDAAGVAVFFGSASDLWACNACDLVSNTLQDKPKPAAVILAPPPGKPLSKKYWKAPKHLSKVDCQSSSWNELDRWAEEVLRGCRGE
jgi:hypothetical protein